MQCPLFETVKIITKKEIRKQMYIANEYRFVKQGREQDQRSGYPRP